MSKLFCFLVLLIKYNLKINMKVLFSLFIGICNPFPIVFLQQLPHMMNKMITRLGDKMDKLGQRLSKHESEDMEDEEGDPVLMDITLDMDKHPPAELPSMPGGLNTLQVKVLLCFGENI